MNPTHTRRPEFGEPYQVAAWQYDPAAPIPVWVARKFHSLTHPHTHPFTHSRPRLTALSSISPFIIIATPGDWIVRITPGGQYQAVLTDIEFRLNFEPLPEPCATQPISS